MANAAGDRHRFRFCVGLLRLGDRPSEARTLAMALLLSGTLLLLDPLHFIGTDFLEMFFPVVLALILMIAFSGLDERARLMRIG